MSKAKKLLLTLGVGAASVVSTSAMAAIDIQATVDKMVADGTIVIAAIGIGMMTLAAGTVVFKWGKAQFF
ncbi:hypothetical protein KFE26_20220 [Shewanella sp. M16]|jgi:hypothetical protein|uniref:hypothetical protein n=1 Tax=Shewanella sp. M16 TaxID=2830837 RepID=UPI001B706A42|nr:hypothetical protein [Shewanella sp. M16]MBP7662321.1 hypothetical protein [Shewanella sp.]MBS0044600.1 hypothetical protein [Shewanella sp. M16]